MRRISHWTAGAAVVTVGLIGGGVAHGGVVAGDIALGLPDSDPGQTLEIIRGGGTANSDAGDVAGEFDNQFDLTFVQSVEFDNAGGTARNPGGNLLGAVRGSASGPASPAKIFNIATQGSAYDSGTFQNLWTAPVDDKGTPGDTSDDTAEQVDRLAVSPNNTRLAQTSATNNELIVHNYNAGAAPGSGSGASITGTSRVDLSSHLGGGSEGAAWLNNTDVVVAADDGALVRVNGVDNPGAASVSVVANGLGGSETDVEYLPSVSDYVAVSSGVFDGSTTNTLTLLDPDNSFDVVDSMTFNNAGTAREIAFEGDGDLIVSGFGSELTRITSVADGDLSDAVVSTDIYSSDNFEAFPGHSVAVPEPTSLVLLVLGALAMVPRRRRSA